ncbi:hypothetical protein RhiirA5_381834 [Rhizophagus irregularis]|uniref:Uncharacterized protein n=2 Tax=Rhizophagus irregularis TaxID=588596 RepID=A0A2N0P3A6_9GLOM|nr:hypothetical protein GLOIN_2v1818822 [Rhizophagus irregularis DAOM 181602=DAOM 197198]PKC01301.1 hypothetical protein RhiirA5_381834 [Rhizophagus irregularis]POG59434.1 hypothetical protein GLOIN_2v1818822 [Rhizophagus irregularis DAOM 181602=DAOM 197198]CAB4477939.1 unnamed protein product [Rhizophagus irregularis]|eukprot:XP_025166300.1 hypothetical protein GLOIN_2v1818822 [Rhizophagus irregularis DAOM 181602=DAOM 197198]
MSKNNNKKINLSITTTTKNAKDTTTTIIINSKGEIFLKKILKDFHNKIIQTKDFNNFEKFLVEWMKLKFEINKNDPKKIFNLMKNLKFYYDNNNNNKRNNNNNFIWFTSLMGFFYQFGIGCIMNEKIALDLYFLSVNKKNHDDDDDDYDNEIPPLTLNDDFNNKLYLTEENRNEFNLLKNNNIIIGKYLLSLYYYKDIIIINTVNTMILKVNEFTIDKQMELQEQPICNDNNIIQDSIKKLKSQENKENTNNNTNNSIMNKKKISKEEFENIKRSALKGNSEAQYNLAICYMDGIETTKSKLKAAEWFL